MTVYFFIEILLIHFLADFALQTHYQATNKGIGYDLINYPLLRHVVVYSLVFSVWFLARFQDPWIALLFLGYNILTHYVTDWITSRLSKPFFETAYEWMLNKEEIIKNYGRV